MTQLFPNYFQDRMWNLLVLLNLQRNSLLNLSWGISSTYPVHSFLRSYCYDSYIDQPQFQWTISEHFLLCWYSCKSNYSLAYLYHAPQWVNLILFLVVSCRNQNLILLFGLIEVATNLVYYFLWNYSSVQCSGSFSGFVFE